MMMNRLILGCSTHVQRSSLPSLSVKRFASTNSSRVALPTAPAASSRRYAGASAAAIALVCFGLNASEQTSFAKPLSAPTLSLYTWGNGFFGQLGHGKEQNEFVPRVVSHFAAMDASPVLVSCGGSVTAALSEDGRLFTWGSGDMRGGFTNQSVPEVLRLPADAGRAKSVTVGGLHGIVLTEHGDLYTWGRSNNFGQLGHGKGVKVAAGDVAKVQVADGTKFAQVSCGLNHTAAIDTNGRVYTWGCGRDGALGLGDKDNRETPTLVSGELAGKKARQVACGRESTVVLLEDGSVWSFGSDDLGQLGCGATSRYQRTPVQIQSLSKEKVVSIAAGEFHAAAVTDAGEVFMWGNNRDGQLGQGNRDDVSVPKRVNALLGDPISSVSCGGGHTAVITKSGHLYCFGRGRDGQLSRSKAAESVAAYRTLPQHVELFEHDHLQIVAVACGNDHTAAIAISKS